MAAFNLMKTAWEAARELSGIYGGTAQQYVPGLMKDLGAYQRGAVTWDEMTDPYNFVPTAMDEIREEGGTDYAEALIDICNTELMYWLAAGNRESPFTMARAGAYMYLTEYLESISHETLNKALRQQIGGRRVYDACIEALDRISHTYDTDYASNASSVPGEIVAFVDEGMRLTERLKKPSKHSQAKKAKKRLAKFEAAEKRGMSMIDILSDELEKYTTPIPL